MHAGRILSQKRKHQLEQRRRSRLNSGLPSVDLSTSSSDAPWYLDKWDERRRAFSSAKNAKGLNLFHLFGSIALLGMGLIFLAITVLSVPGLLEIGVSVVLFSMFCIIFVRCDEDKLAKDEEPDDNALDDVVIETQSDVPSDKYTHSADSSTSDIDDSSRDLIRANLLRSNPRRIPSPVRGYIQNFSPITEVSEPSSCASSYLTKSYEVSKLAKSYTNDSLRSNRGGGPSSSIGGPPGGSPIEEEEDNYHYNTHSQGDAEHDPGGKGNFTASNPSLHSHSSSVDTEDDSSVTADISVMTVLERKGCTNSYNRSRDEEDVDKDATPKGSFDCEEEMFEAE